VIGDGAAFVNVGCPDVKRHRGDLESKPTISIAPPTSRSAGKFGCASFEAISGIFVAPVAP
jgi:hypothetical protein